MNTKQHRLHALLLRGCAVGYIVLLILLPVSAICLSCIRSRMGTVFSALGRPQALHALQLTLITACGMVVVNILLGTAMAWILVRYDFPGKQLVNALIDLPFAIPTVVTGIMLVTLYGPTSVAGAFFSSLGIDIIYAKPGIILALIFVSFPFVVRAVQPVLLEMDRDMEEAAHTLGATPWYTFRRVVLPPLIPAILSGATLSFSRALGEFGAIVMVAGNIPFHTQVASVFIYGEIEGDNIPGALAVSLVLLALSFLVLLVLNLLQRKVANENIL